jgi:hypothetical protein
MTATYGKTVREVNPGDPSAADLFLLEYLAVRHGSHPRWAGDPVLNAEAFTRRWARQHPEFVPAVAAAVEAAAGDRLPPAAAAGISARLREHAGAPAPLASGTAAPPPDRAAKRGDR